MSSRSVQSLFRPLDAFGLALPNRIVMAPMTRSFSPGGVPGSDVAAYYRRRAAAGVALIITEGIYIPHPKAGFDPQVPRLYGEAALEGWKKVVHEVHEAGGRIFAQLWHVGKQVAGGPAPPEGIEPCGADMPGEDLAAVTTAYGDAAANAQACGFDGVEIHGAHGYLIDQFFWEHTNHRRDLYGGSLIARTRFGVGIVEEIRRRVGPAFPISLRFSQFKVADYEARIAETPAELDRFLTPFVEAGVSALHASTRRFWDPAFPGSALTLAGWTKKLTGLPTIAVGSVTLDTDMMSTFRVTDHAACTNLDALLDLMERDEFDLIAIGRALLANPEWVHLVESSGVSALKPFDRSILSRLE